MFDKNKIINSLKDKEINEETISYSLIKCELFETFDNSKEGQSDVDFFFGNIYGNQEIYIKSNLIKSFTIDGENGITYDIRIFEHYVDSGSDDYCYSFDIYTN